MWESKLTSILGFKIEIKTKYQTMNLELKIRKTSEASLSECFNQYKTKTG